MREKFEGQFQLNFFPPFFSKLLRGLYNIPVVHFHLVND